MDQPSRPESPPAAANPPDDRLDSWKEIAAYFRRDVTTVQRWEKKEGMPVHRHLHARMGSVYASRAALDAWARSRHVGVGGEADVTGEPALPTADLPSADTSAEGRGPAGEQSDPAAAPMVADAARGSHGIAWVVSAAAGVLGLAAALWLLNARQVAPGFEISEARFLPVTDFDGTEQSAAISPDGQWVAFLSDRDGRVDVWLTQLGTGQFQNLTRGLVSGLVNPSVRTLAFSPDGQDVTFWMNRSAGSEPSDIGVWAVSIRGGEPRPYLEGVAEFDWSEDGSRLVYHTPADGDPTFVREPGVERDRPVFVAPPGVHGHFPIWSRDRAHIYFVHGPLDRMDIWRIGASGGTAERITHHESRVSHPVFIDDRTLLYLADDGDRGGARLYSVDVERRVPRQVSSGIERYTSLAAAADGRRLVVTQDGTRHTFWRASLSDRSVDIAAAREVSLTTSRGSFPRLGPGYLVYVIPSDDGDSIWKLQGEAATQLWTAPGARIVGAPSIAPDGDRISFSIRQQGRTLLYVIEADGSAPRIVSRSLTLEGSPTWTPGGESITSAAVQDGVPRLFEVPLDGGPSTRIVDKHAQDPEWHPGGGFVLFSGPDVGTVFVLRAAAPGGAGHPIPAIELTRGARHVRFVPGRETVMVMRGGIAHKNLWLIDLKSGMERQVTDLPPDFQVRDFDISPDGSEVVLERVQEQSDIVLIDLPRQ